MEEKLVKFFLGALPTGGPLVISGVLNSHCLVEVWKWVLGAAFNDLLQAGSQTDM